MRSLEDRRVLVVGAGTRATEDPDAPPGNGRAIAVTAAQAGAVVVCADLDGDAARATVALVEAEGGRAHAIEVDVTDDAACSALPGAAADAMGGLDGLVCNVGIGETTGFDIVGTTPAAWDGVFAVNVRSHFVLTAAALPVLGAGGAIVYISSVAGLKGGTRRPAYDASKAALTGLCRQAALEGAPRGIRANIVAPGRIDTPMGRDAAAARSSTTPLGVPLGRQGTAWEVAHPVVFLLGDGAGFITSQLLAVDGGSTGCRG